MGKFELCSLFSLRVCRNMNCAQSNGKEDMASKHNGGGLFFPFLKSEAEIVKRQGE